MSERLPKHINANRVEIHRGYEADRISKMNGKPMRLYPQTLGLLKTSGADKVVIDHAEGRTVISPNQPPYLHN